jgi:hypothetical protein
VITSCDALRNAVAAVPARPVIGNSNTARTFRNVHSHQDHEPQSSAAKRPQTAD